MAKLFRGSSTLSSHGLYDKSKSVFVVVKIVGVSQENEPSTRNGSYTKMYVCNILCMKSHVAAAAAAAQHVSMNITHLRTPKPPLTYLGDRHCRRGRRNQESVNGSVTAAATNESVSDYMNNNKIQRKALKGKAR